MTSDQFFKDVLQNTQSEVRLDPISKIAYSVDASIFEIEPLGVILPKTTADLQIVIQLANRYQIPLIARGAATGIAGGCIGKGVILDLSKYLNQILEIDLNKHTVICEPGVIQDRLNEALAPSGFRLGPDTSTGNRATIGGMVANNAAGAHSLRFGTMADAVVSIEMILATGEKIVFQELSPDEWMQKCMLSNQEGHIYRTITKILEENKDEILKRFPPLPRRVSGYNLDKLLKIKNLAKVVSGSEGTLGVMSKIEIKIVPKPLFTKLCLIGFNSQEEAFEWLPDLLKWQLFSLEMIDDQILSIGMQAPSLKGKMAWLKNLPKALLIAEFEGNSEDEALEKIHSFEQDLLKKKVGSFVTPLLNAQDVKNLWELRKAGLGLLLSKKSYTRAIAFIEDLSIPPQNLIPFMNQFHALLKEYHLQAGIYGHVGQGCMHIRPFLNMREKKDLELIKMIMEQVSSLLLTYQGALSGEHGDGLIRSYLNEKMFGPKIYQSFIQLKIAFDPKNLMNPGKIVHADLPLQNLRIDPTTPIREFSTFFDFSKEGGFALAVDLCNGNGQCRKKEAVMCPSFQATGDEYDTTRARSQALRALIHGKLEMNDQTFDEIHAVLDLCLSCKGCKTECPSHVDMAKMKAEFLYQYQLTRGVRFRNWVIANLGIMNWFGSFCSSLFNWINTSSFFKKWISYAGFAKERTLPLLATTCFSKWFKTFTTTQKEKQVVLWNDTYTEYYHPEIGQAAVKVLSQLGYQVIVPSWICCGRPAISKGLLEQAKKSALKVLETLTPYLQQKIPIIVLEPSCHSAFMDEYVDLLGSQTCESLLTHCKSLDQFLHEHLENGRLPLSCKEENLSIKAHGHCHQKALFGTSAFIKTLQALPGCQVTEIESGCCGMAGAFGYEQEHYPISQKIGELKLFPSIRNMKEAEVIVADGFSCRTQILDGTGKKAMHIAELIASRMNSRISAFND